MAKMLLVFLLSHMVLSQTREIFVDDEVPIFKVDGHDKVEIAEDAKEEIEHAPCHMEYQVMKRVVGTCIKLGKTAMGCVAGNYLHPLHPECMAS
ncbi:uncharacterized protein LOC132705447 [Cylas formicarius]|uniref:uncharacterized protein LOC132705447 n=1 Tax=Cylas formicarius TaxID=197179 RepID=UPI0029585FF7|nr:uncharacterized protein LOC132705447 [Cylas formicarius]